MKQQNIAIVGAGASGLFSAVLLSSRPGVHIHIFEKNNKIASKLRASGGGRANILNAHILPIHYNNTDFMNTFLQKVDYKTIEKVFLNLGLLMRMDEENRVYPATFCSQTVVDILSHRLHENCEISCGYEIKKLSFCNRKWQIDDEKILFDQVILASGSPAGLKMKNRNEYNAYLASLSLKTSKLQPSLVGFKIQDYPKLLFGCRAKARVTLFQKSVPLYSEVGEVMFKEDGVSGIVILNISAYYNRLKEKENCELSLDFLYDHEQLSPKKYLQNHGDMIGVLHPHLCELYRQRSFSLRDFRLKIKGCYDLETAQVCSGGVSLQ